MIPLTKNKSRSTVEKPRICRFQNSHPHFRQVRRWAERGHHMELQQDAAQQGQARVREARDGMV